VLFNNYRGEAENAGKEIFHETKAKAETFPNQKKTALTSHVFYP